MDSDETKYTKKFSKDALIPGNLIWNVKFEIGYESGQLIVEVNSSNRTWMEQNHAAFDEADRILKLRGFKTVTSIKRIPLAWADRRKPQ